MKKEGTVDHAEETLKFRNSFLSKMGSDYGVVAYNFGELYGYMRLALDKRSAQKFEPVANEIIMLWKAIEALQNKDKTPVSFANDINPCPPCDHAGAKMTWIKVEDGLPEEDKQEVLFFGLDTDVRGIVYKKIFAGRYRIFKDTPEENGFYGRSGEWIEATHWMPMLEGPAEQ